MEQNIFDRDEALERAMLESCLLFDKRKKTGKRELLLPKKILSHRLKGDFTTIDGAISFMKNRQHFDIDEIQIKNAIKNLSDNNFLELKDNGDLILMRIRS